MAITGKTGADAIFKALKRICIVITHFRTKLISVINSAVAANVITSAQGTTAIDFVNAAAEVCTIFGLVAGYSGF